MHWMPVSVRPRSVTVLAALLLGALGALASAPGAFSSRPSPRFVPLYWRVACSDVVILGTYQEVDGAHRLTEQECLRGTFRPTRPFVFQGNDARMLETEPLGIEPGLPAVFLLRETTLEDGTTAYTVSQGSGSRGAFPIVDPMPTFSTGLYELSLADTKTLPRADFEERLRTDCEEVEVLDHLLHRYEHPLRGDSEVSAYELYPALARVRREDVEGAVERITKDLASDPASWIRTQALRALETLERRARD